MIGGKLDKCHLVHTHCSCFLPSPTMIFTRNLCTFESSLVQLSTDIYFLYHDLMVNTRMCRYRLTVIQQKLVLGLYVLSPLQVNRIKDEDLTQFYHDTLPDCPDIMLRPCSDPDIFDVVMSDKDDVWVLMGLSLTLFRYSYGSLPKDCYRLDHLVDSFYESLQQMGKVDRLYRVELHTSLSNIPISLILDKVKPLVGDGSVVYKLISSFLKLPIIDDDGNHRSDMSYGGIPPGGEIARVLFNIALMDIFDREFAKRFPGIAFSRFINEIYISTRGNDDVIFNEKAGYALLEELSLAGQIESIGPSVDDGLPCLYRKMMVFLDLDSDRNVNVCDY